MSFPSKKAHSLASWLVVFHSGDLGVMRWLEKPPDPSAMQAQEPKTRVVPLGTLLASFDPAIEFVDVPYLARQLSVFSHQACSGIPLAVGL